MTLKSRVKKLEGGKSEVCTCSQKKITASMDPIEASRIYHQNIKCTAHLSSKKDINTKEMSLEEATRIYREMIQ